MKTALPKGETIQVDGDRTLPFPRRVHPESLILAVARQLDELENRYNALDERSSRLRESSTDKIYNQTEMDDLYDRIDCLNAFLTSQVASTPEEALVQLVQVSRLASLLIDLEIDKVEAEQISRRLRRLFYSMARSISDNANEHTLTIQRLGDHRDPWIPSEVRVAEIKKQTGDCTASPA